MARYFIEVAYKGTNYSGFQIQENAVTIQDCITKALQTIFKIPFELTGSSRTDAGVHAQQNFFHFDTDVECSIDKLYNLNAVLPKDIAVNRLIAVQPDAHCRFDAIYRGYQYCIHKHKNPFLNDTSWFYPYQIDESLLHHAANFILDNTNFQSFAKQNSQVFTHKCTIVKSTWEKTAWGFTYNVQANRFLRGMVRALVATMLKVARGAMTINQFQQLFIMSNNCKADFAAPAHGLTLLEVQYPSRIRLQ
jgi:tRNA pseudouridine38-40 synthase